MMPYIIVVGAKKNSWCGSQNSQSISILNIESVVQIDLYS